MKAPVFIKKAMVLRIHEHQLEQYGGSAGIRDLGALEAALAMPESGFGDDYLHKDIFEMAGAYLFHFAKNHPLVDGNKRVAAACAEYFLDLNGYVLPVGNQAFYELTMDIAGSKRSKQDAARFFKKYAKKKR
jgi:death-on-curing protein